MNVTLNSIYFKPSYSAAVKLVQRFEEVIKTCRLLRDQMQEIQIGIEQVSNVQAWHLYPLFLSP